MKKLTCILIVAVVISAGLVAETFTNGFLSPRLPLSDTVYQGLVLIRQTTGKTNVPLTQFVTNNLYASLNEDAVAALNQYKADMMLKLSACTNSTKLLQISAILDAP